MANGIPSISEDLTHENNPEIEINENLKPDISAFYEDIESRDNKGSILHTVKSLDDFSNMNHEDFRSIFIETQRWINQNPDFNDPEPFRPKVDEVAYFMAALVQKRKLLTPTTRNHDLSDEEYQQENRQGEIAFATSSMLEKHVNTIVYPLEFLSIIRDGANDARKYESNFKLIKKLTNLNPFIITYKEDVPVQKNPEDLKVDELVEFYSNLGMHLAAEIIKLGAEGNSESTLKYMENVRDSIVPLWQNKIIAARR
jgi:hypothetical protein